MSTTVKVSNNTKDAKGVLAQFRLVDVDLECCGEMVPTGGSIEVLAEDWALNKRSYERLVKLGALSVEDVVEQAAPKAARPALVHLEETDSTNPED